MKTTILDDFKCPPDAILKADFWERVYCIYIELGDARLKIAITPEGKIYLALKERR